MKNKNSEDDRNPIKSSNIVNDFRLKGCLQRGEKPRRHGFDFRPGRHRNNPRKICAVPFERGVNHQRFRSLVEMDQGALVRNLHLGQGGRRDKTTVPVGPGREG